MGERRNDSGENSQPDASTRRFWLDVRRRGMGWEFVVGATVAPERIGWRPTKGWAKNAGKRSIRKLGGGS